jgi:hypothetical protein
VIDAAAPEPALDMQLRQPFYQALGRDLVIWDRPQWTAA